MPRIEEFGEAEWRRVLQKLIEAWARLPEDERRWIVESSEWLQEERARLIREEWTVEE